jgi:hypothetical protein
MSILLRSFHDIMGLKVMIEITLLKSLHYEKAVDPDFVRLLYTIKIKKVSDEESLGVKAISLKKNFFYLAT